MGKFILKVKHWQLFLILCGIPLICKVSFTGTLSSLAISDLTYLLYVVFGYTWMLLLGLELNRKKPIFNPKDLFIFKSIAAFFILVPIVVKIYHAENVLLRTSTWIFLTFFVFQLILHLVFIHYPAKALKANEVNMDIDINDYFGDILLILFWPIGIWFIQPRVNKIIK